MEESNVEIKCLLLGSNFCGKRNLIFRYCEDEFYADLEYTPPFMDDYNRQLTIQNTSVNLTISFFQNDYIPIGKALVSQSQCFLICFSLTDIQSFNQTREFFDLIKQNQTKPSPIILVGTHLDDVSNRSVETEQITTLTSEFQCDYILTSARTGESVTQAFENVIIQYLNQVKEEQQHVKKDKQKEKKDGSNKEKCDLG